LFGRKKNPLEGLDDLLRMRLQQLVEKDPEFRALLRHAIREHLEVLRNELVSLDKANQQLMEAFQIGLEQIDALTERVKVLEDALLKRRALPDPDE
jgi:hypothetical protein